MTIIIITITVIFSYAAFQKPELMYRYQFNAYQVVHRKEWHRIISYGFLHANWEHLFVNMLVLYFFGTSLQRYFTYFFGAMGTIYFIVLYLGAIVIATIYDLFQQKDNYYYNAIGASGATSAVVFATILFAPMAKIYIMFVLPIPGIILAPAYLYYSYYMSKKNVDNIGHNAHFYGAIFGFIFPLILKPQLFNWFLSHLF